jgi:fucose permease
MNQYLKIKLSLYLNYFVFAILLNSVGIVILKSIQNYGVDEVQASVLELFKDMPIAIVSFLVASFLPRLGYRKSMLSGLVLVAVGCLIMLFGNSFLAAKVLFALVGISFALIKVSVYSMIGLVTKDDKEHGSLMSSIEGVFMFGIALAYFLFPAFNNDTQPNSWLNVYWLLGALSMVSFLFLWSTQFEEPIPPTINLSEDFSKMLGLLFKILVIVFVVCAFLFVMIEQGIMTWLPTFNNTVLKLSTNTSIMMASILAISLGVGRLLAGMMTKRFNVFYILLGCIVCSMALVLVVLPQTTKLEAVAQEISSISQIPLLGFAFPVVGLFIAPIYPLLNSMVLSALPKNLHSPMTGLIVVFSALGGTLGSRIVGYMFKNYGAQNGFYFTLIPMAILFVSLFILRKIIPNTNEGK